jgi:hypothetical protein
MPHKDPEAARAWRREWWKRSPEIREKQNTRTRQMKAKINAMLREHKLGVGIRHWEERYPCKPDIFEATYEAA